MNTIYMSKALSLAELGRHTVSPNPMVGCVIVKNNIIVGQGYHIKAGHQHAEIHALQQAGSEAENAEVYLTLEPCCHYGKTPPCVDALINAKVKKVHVACLDPNPLMCGKSIEMLRKANIDVAVGEQKEKALKLNEIFFYFIKHKRPFVIAKWAMSLDGHTITNPNDSRKISCNESQIHSHEIRRQIDAIIIGANTARIDNPQLTSRLIPQISEKQPIRIIMTTNFDTLPLNLKIFDKKLPGKTLIATTRYSNKLKLYNHVDILLLKSNQSGLVDLNNLLDELGKREITSLLVEGGNTIHNNFFKEGLINKVHAYIAPTIISKLTTKKNVTKLQFNQLGDDFYFEGHL